MQYKWKYLSVKGAFFGSNSPPPVMLNSFQHLLRHSDSGKLILKPFRVGVGNGQHLFSLLRYLWRITLLASVCTPQAGVKDDFL